MASDSHRAVLIFFRRFHSKFQFRKDFWVVKQIFQYFAMYHLSTIRIAVITLKLRPKRFWYYINSWYYWFDRKLFCLHPCLSWPQNHIRKALTKICKHSSWLILKRYFENWMDRANSTNRNKREYSTPKCANSTKH